MKYFLTISLVVIVVIVGAWWLLNGASTKQTGQSTGSTVTLPIGGSNPSGSQGGQTQTSAKDILQDPALKQSPTAGYYYLGYQPSYDASGNAPTSVPPYLIEYIAATRYYNVELLSEPIGLTRQSAEQYLMAHLGIGKSQMCALNYMVSTPYWVNSTFAGTNLEFSFCPGATQLP